MPSTRIRLLAQQLRHAMPCLLLFTVIEPSSRSSGMRINDCPANNHALQPAWIACACEFPVGGGDVDASTNRLTLESWLDIR